MNTKKDPLLIFLITVFLLLVVLCIGQFMSSTKNTNTLATIQNTFKKNCLDEAFDMIVCICLPERKEHMKSVFENWGVKKVEFFDAFLKKNYDHQDFINMGFLKSNYSDYLNLGRVCCHFSAIAVYKKFLESSAQSIIVFEDDINKDTYKTKTEFNMGVCPLIKSIPKDWEYLNFSKCHDDCYKNKSINNYWSIPERPLCRTAIALKKKAAKIIVDNTVPMSNKPGDKMIGELIQKKRFKAYATKDITFFQHREKFGSTLNNTAPTNPPKCQRTTMWF